MPIIVFNVSTVDPVTQITPQIIFDGLARKGFTPTEIRSYATHQSILRIGPTGSNTIQSTLRVEAQVIAPQVNWSNLPNITITGILGPIKLASGFTIGVTPIIGPISIPPPDIT